MPKKPLPPEVVALTARYKDGQDKLLDIIKNSEAKGNVTAYRRELLTGVKQELRLLDEFSGKWVKDVIPGVYNSGTLDAYKKFRAANVAVGEIAFNTKVVDNLVDNTIGKLSDATNFVGRRIQDDLRRAGLEATTQKAITGSTVKQTKANLLARMAEKGIVAIRDKAGREMNLDIYASTVARTTSREASNLGSINAVKELGHDLVKMSQHYSACPLCSRFENRVYSISGKSKDYPPLSEAFSAGYSTVHPNCFVSGTPVLARGVISHSSRYYVGEVVAIDISGGNQLTVTPNHPILTDKGWVDAGLLVKGDKVVKYSRTKELFARVNPNDIHVETAIEDIPSSLGKSCSVSTRRMKTTTEQFHGDGTNGEIAVINTYGLLRNKINIGIFKKFRKRFFNSRSKLSSFFNTKGTSGQITNGTDRPSNGIMSIFSKLLAFFTGHSCSTRFTSFRSIDSGHDSLAFEPVIDSHVTNTKMQSDMMFRHSGIVHGNNFINRKIKLIALYFRINSGAKRTETQSTTLGVNFNPSFTNSNNGCDLLNSLSGKIEFLDIIKVERNNFSGHVFNLHTSSEWYLANSIITHNCDHVVFPYFPEFDDNAAKVKEDSNKPFEVDPKKKASIEAYNKDQKVKQLRRADRNDYEYMKLKYPDEAPKTFSGYRSKVRAGTLPNVDMTRAKDK